MTYLSLLIIITVFSGIFCGPGHVKHVDDDDDDDDSATVKSSNE